jgi:ribosomal-protein-alanine N-acetyltransferase
MIKEITSSSLELKKFLNENKISIIDNDPFSKFIVYLEDTKIIGFLSYSVIYERAEINYIFVLESYRGKKIASKMLNYMISSCKICDNITLEVRKSNSIAISLYKKFGFKEVAIRENYYNNEDGILMMLVVK